MRYTNFIVKNFRGIEEVNLDLTNDRVITLVGLNESGKTTILEALNNFYGMCREKVPDSKTITTFRPKSISFNGKITIGATISLDESDKNTIATFAKSEGAKKNLEIPDTYTYTFTFNFKQSQYVDYSKTCGFSVKSVGAKKSLHSTNNALWNKIINKINKEMIPEILYYDDFIFEVPEKTYFPLSTDAPDKGSKNQEWQLVLDDILRSVDANYDSFQHNIADIWLTDNDLAANTVSAMEKKLDSVITTAWGNLFKNKGRANFKEIKLNTTVSADQQYLEVSFKVKTDSGRLFNLDERSKGCKWFFSFLLFTEFRKSRSHEILFLLDEPASNLHSSAQKNIMDAISELSSSSTVIYSTHSHFLINTLWLTGAHIVVNKAIDEEQLDGAFTESEAKITTKRYYDFVANSKQENSKLLFQPILDALDYQYTDFDMVSGVVITEGKYDWYVFKYIFNIILNDNSINLYPGKGRDANEDIIRLYLAWGRDFLYLLDGDKPGETTKKRLLGEFEGFLDGNLFTLHDAVSVAGPTEDLFTDADKKLICDTAFGAGAYDTVKSSKPNLKSKLNFAVLQLLNRKHVIKLDTKTKNKFDNLAKFLKQKITNETSI